MGVSGCTSCQLGGIEALQAYERAYQAKLNDEAKNNAPSPDPNQVGQSLSIFENRPIAGATIGSNINIRA